MARFNGERLPEMGHAVDAVDHEVACLEPVLIAIGTCSIHPLKF
jgi:hypothetical protein